MQSTSIYWGDVRMLFMAMKEFYLKKRRKQNQNFQFCFFNSKNDLYFLQGREGRPGQDGQAGSPGEGV